MRLCVDAVELSHASAQIALDRLHDDVEVVVHESVGVAYPVEAPADLAKEGEPALAVSIVQIDGPPPVATRGNVVQRAGEFNSQESRHALMLQRPMLHFKT